MSDDDYYSKAHIFNGDYEITHNLSALFSSPERDFLIRNNGDKVKISSLKGKILGIYFNEFSHDYGSTSKLVKIYEKLVASKGDFEVVFVSFDRSEEEFNLFFSKLPWLAVPFSEAKDIQKRMMKWFVVGSPFLVIIGSNGKLLTEEGNPLVLKIYGADAYPFTPERFKFLKERDEEAKRNQSLTSLLVTNYRDYVLSNNGNQVPVSELVGKMVGLYLDCRSLEFTPTLINVYNKLKEKGEEFEVVFISHDDQEEDFKEGVKRMPWLTLPYKDKQRKKFWTYFDIGEMAIPVLIIIGPDGKTLNHNAVALIEEHGIDAFPFTPERLEELEKAKQKPVSLESLLVFGGNDFVIGKGGLKVPVSELVGKNILLYFSSYSSCPFRRALVKAYHDIKARDNAFEVIFISSYFSPFSSEEQTEFDKCFSKMRWLALPFSDHVRNKRLEHWFKIKWIPTAIFISSSGRTVTNNVVELIRAFGVDAYPFTEEQLKYLGGKFDEVKACRAPCGT